MLASDSPSIVSVGASVINPVPDAYELLALRLVEGPDGINEKV